MLSLVFCMSLLLTYLCTGGIYQGYCEDDHLQTSGTFPSHTVEPTTRTVRRTQSRTSPVERLAQREKLQREYGRPLPAQPPPIILQAIEQRLYAMHQLGGHAQVWSFVLLLENILKLCTS